METENAVLSFFLKPFALGLYAGLLFSLFVFIRGKVQLRKLQKEQDNLRRHIQTKLEIESEENMRKRKDFEDLRKENENLRLAVQAYAAKPRRREVRMLHVYQRAVEILTEKAPGFAQSWQSVLKEAEGETERAERGTIPFIGRFLPRASKGPRRPKRNGSS